MCLDAAAERAVTDFSASVSTAWKTNTELTSKYN